jgi:hypothetical protein
MLGGGPDDGPSFGCATEGAQCLTLSQCCPDRVSSLSGLGGDLQRAPSCQLRAGRVARGQERLCKLRQQECAPEPEIDSAAQVVRLRQK